MITVNFKSYNNYVTDSLYQWDTNHVLSVSGLNLSTAPEVHFYNSTMDKAIVKQSTLDDYIVTVSIPNSLLQSPYPIYANIGIYEGDSFKTIETVKIPVIAKARPADYRLEKDDEIYSFEALKNDINNRVTNVQFNRDLNTVNARVNNIIANSNSTENNSELIDIRTGADGEVYGSAGDAVRQQLGNLPLTKKADRLVYGRVEVDSVAGTITTVANEGSEPFFYVKDTFIWFKDLSNDSFNYTEIIADNGSGNSWAYVIDTVGKTFALRRLGAGKTDVQRILSTDVVLFIMLTSPTGHISMVIPYCDNIYLDGVLQLHMSNMVRPWNRLVGTLGGKIEIDTSLKTLSLSGIMFFESEMWHNFENCTIDLTSYPMSESGGTIRITIDSDFNLKISDLTKPCDYKEILVCLIFASGTWGFDASRVYIDDTLKHFTYVDGAVMAQNTNELKSEINNINNNINGLKKVTNTNKTTCNIFKKVVCCGDSYTAGYITDPDGVVHATNEDYAWPHYMSKLTGNTWINCGQSGANALTWQSGGRGLTKAQSSGKAQAYIIGLMINDCGTSANSLTLGSVSDIGTDNETYYGSMSKIIRELNAINPKAKIFVCTCPNNGGAFTPYNQAVYDIVNAYKDTYPVHCLDLLANIEMYSNISLTNDSHYGHYTAIGYEQFAEILSVIMSNYINDNIADFQDVAFIEYDE